MKERFAWVLVIAMCLAMLTACGGDSTDESSSGDTSSTDTTSSEPIVMKLGHGLSDATTMGKAVQEWADQVKEDTEGRVEIEVYPSGQLGSMTEIIEAIDLGTLDMALGDSSLMTETVLELNLLSMPMLIKDYEMWKTVAYGSVGDALKEKVAEQSNIVCLGWMFNGFREVLSVKPITSLESCKDTIIRSPEADVYIQTLTNMNFTPTALSFSEVYTALQTDVVQACETSYEQFIQNSFCEIAKHLLESNHMAATMSVLVNSSTWDKISEEDKALMMDAYNEIMPACDDAVYAEAEGYKQQLIDEYGCDVYYYTDEEREILNERFQEYWTTAAEADNFTDLLEEVLALG